MDKNIPSRSIYLGVPDDILIKSAINLPTYTF